MEILFILENSWFNYIGDQRKSSKNETPYPGSMPGGGARGHNLEHLQKVGFLR